MERRKKRFNWHEFRVGIFVIGSFAILIFMIVRVSGGRGFFTPKSYAVTYLPEISGLKAGAPVWLNGIEIGNVEDIKLEKSPPDTQANRDTNDKIQQLVADIQRYDDLILDVEQSVARDRAGLASAKPADAAKRREEILLQEERLARLRKNRQATRQDLKTTRGNIQSIRLVLQIEDEFAGWIKRDSEVSIGSIGLLGDKYVDISIGRLPEEPRRTAEGHIFIEAVNEATIRQLMVNANDLMANFGDISDRVKSIVAKLDAGEGTIGQLINETSLHRSLVDTIQNLDVTVQRAGGLMDELRSSQGTFGQLVHNRALYDELTATAKELNQFISRLNSSAGTVNKLINDPELYDNLRKISARVDQLLLRIERGEGTLGKMSTDPALFEEARDSLMKVRQILEQIDRGEGTMGQLLKDKQLYENLNSALAELAKLIYDVRQNPKDYLRIQFKVF